MEKLIELLRDGRSRTLEMLASELGTSEEVIKRDIDFLERTNVIKRVDFSSHGSESSCASCSGCSGGNKKCAGCMPDGGFQNMGIMWEVVDR